MRVRKLYPQLVYIHIFSCWYRCSVKPTKNKSVYVLCTLFWVRKLYPQIYFVYVESVLFVPKLIESFNNNMVNNNIKAVSLLTQADRR